MSLLSCVLQRAVRHITSHSGVEWQAGMNRNTNLFHIRVVESHLYFILRLFSKWNSSCDSDPHCIKDGTIEVFACDCGDNLFNGFKMKALSADFDVEALFYGVKDNAGE